VGKVGVAIDSLDDMHRLFDGIPLGEVSTSMTINSTAPILLLLYQIVAEEQGVAPERIRGTVQNDILKEYAARGTYIYPPGPSLKLVTDIIAFCADRVPKWNTISISGYHMREAGCTAVQEVAFTLANALTYVEAALARGLAIDDFAPRLSFHFATGLDFFEEIAKLRAARRLWARIVTERYGAANPRSAALRFFSGCSGTCLTVQEPLNNIIRSAIQCLAAVLAGAQSIHVMAYDEAFEIPTEESVLLSLRTQQIIARETGVTNVIDPLGGSYYVEKLTDTLEEEARKLMDRIQDLGGTVAAITAGELQRWIGDTSYQTQRATHTGEKPVVGVNVYAGDGTQTRQPVRLFEVDESLRERQLDRLAEVRRRRDNEAVRRTLGALKQAAGGNENLMPYIIEAVQALATIGEISDALREQFGEYQEPLVV
jgi:methylmalonyl-CoA mutase N-terminal domain/subunit